MTMSGVKSDIASNSQSFTLRFSSHQEALSRALTRLLSECYGTDVVLSTGYDHALPSQDIKAHRLILSAFSPYFKSLFEHVPVNQFPIVIIRDMTMTSLKAIIDFCYHGQIMVAKDELDEFVKAAKFLQIEGAKDFVIPSSIMTKTKPSSGHQKVKPHSRVNMNGKRKTNTPLLEQNANVNHVTHSFNQIEKRSNLPVMPEVGSQVRSIREEGNQQQQDEDLQCFILDDDENANDNQVPIVGSIDGIKPEMLECELEEVPEKTNVTSNDGVNDNPLDKINLKLPAGTFVSTKLVDSSIASCSTTSTHESIISTSIVPTMKRVSSAREIAVARAVANSVAASFSEQQQQERKANTNKSFYSTSITTSSSPSSSISISPIKAQTSSSIKRGRGRPRKYHALYPGYEESSSPLSSLQHQTHRPKSAHSMSLMAAQMAKKLNKCPYCPQVYYGKSVMQDHITSVHLNQGAKHVCHLCAREYTWRITLRKHLRKVHKLQAKDISLK